MTTGGAQMKLYLDTGNIDEVADAASYGILDGVTTNPSLIAKEGKDFKETVRKIANILGEYKKDFTVSAEVTEQEHQKMVKQGLELATIHKNVIIKLPSLSEGVKAISILSKKNIKINATLCFSTAQALLVAKAGAYIVSPFIGRLDDINHIGYDLIEEIRTVYDNYNLKTMLLAASIRSPRQVTEVALRGADICTVPYDIFKKLFNHPLTDIGQEKFLADWNKYNKGKSK